MSGSGSISDMWQGDVHRIRVIDAEEYQEDTDDEGRFRFHVVSSDIRGRTQSRAEWLEPGHYTKAQERTLLSLAAPLRTHEHQFRRVTKARISERNCRSDLNPYVSSQKMRIRDTGKNTTVSIAGSRPASSNRKRASGKRPKIDSGIYESQCERHPCCDRGFRHGGLGGHCKITKPVRNTLRKSRVPPPERGTDDSEDSEDEQPLSARAMVMRAPSSSSLVALSFTAPVATVEPPPSPVVRSSNASWRVSNPAHRPPPIRTPADTRPPPPPGFVRKAPAFVPPAAAPPEAPTTEEEQEDDDVEDAEEEYFSPLPVPKSTFSPQEAEGPSVTRPF